MAQANIRALGTARQQVASPLSTLRLPLLGVINQQQFHIGS